MDIPLIKRIDIVLDEKAGLKKRVIVQYDDSKPVEINYQDKCYVDGKSFAADVDYITIVCGNKDIVNALKSQGFIARTSESNKRPLNITISQNLRQHIGEDASSENTTITSVVEKILNNHYNLQ